ncbi:MAG: hypothetical protein KBC73_02345 [Burkholderiaceae bacterium]|nr:hypothetical protein [Burkholderiaceae bacterium]
MKPLWLALASIAMSVTAQFAFKAGMTALKQGALSTPQPLWRLLWAALTQPQVLLGFALYGLGAVIWLRVLADWEVSKAYPLVGLGFAMTAVISLALGEAVGAMRLAGIALICIGVVLVGRS